jgi:hypothetical protein
MRQRIAKIPRDLYMILYDTHWSQRANVIKIWFIGTKYEVIKVNTGTSIIYLYPDTGYVELEENFNFYIAEEIKEAKE